MVTCKKWSILYYRSWIERTRGFIRWRFGLRTGVALHDLFGSLIDCDPLVAFGTLIVLWGAYLDD